MARDDMTDMQLVEEPDMVLQIEHADPAFVDLRRRDPHEFHERVAGHVVQLGVVLYIHMTVQVLPVRWHGVAHEHRQLPDLRHGWHLDSRQWTPPYAALKSAILK